jgi:GT2 family glycosyltransferase
MNWSSNDWTAVLRGTKRPVSCSVVIPAFNNHEQLNLVLAGLAVQAPRLPDEVIVVDDGSSPPLTPEVPDNLRVRMVYLDDRGFGAGRARDVGARFAAGEVIIFLDSDMVPEPCWLAAHAEFHGRSDWLLTVGFRCHVAQRHFALPRDGFTDGPRAALSGSRFFRPEWIEKEWRSSREGLRRSDRLFRVTSGGNLGVTARLYAECGGFDSTMNTWGGEDNDFGYRVYQTGAYIIPARQALAWHLGIGTGNDPNLKQVRAESRARVASLIPHPSLPRIDTAPKYPELAMDVDARGWSPDVLHRLLTDVDSSEDVRGVGLALRVRPDETAAIRSIVAGRENVVLSGESERARASWPYSRVYMQTTSLQAWNVGLIPKVCHLVVEGGSAVVHVLTEGSGGVAATARLVRVIQQVDRGLISETDAFARYAGQFLAVTSNA